MPGEFEKAITIEKAIHEIINRRYLLPAIQRKFTWSDSQICVLFDSIMRNYPINTFMFWEVRDDSVKEAFSFYQFLERYCERFHENNTEFDLKGHGDFFAVIDGQQRLTSLYIGLKGTYAYKLPRKWWPSAEDDSILPPRELHLNLAAPLDEESNEEMMSYEFKFLTKDQFKEDQGKPEKDWFQVGKILDFHTSETPDQVLDIVMNYLQKKGQNSSGYARKALTRLYFAIRLDKTIHFYNETNQRMDHVLDIFIRTNHGGTPLSFSDLLMSITVANWQEDAREQIDNLVDRVRLDSGMQFSIDRNFVLKTALMLSDADVRFKVTNFTADRVKKIEQLWDEIKICILETFKLVRSFGLNDHSLRAKNAAIPIAYYLFHKGRDKTNGKHALYVDINKKQARHNGERNQIRQWLHISLLKGVFSGQGDTLLTSLRRIIGTGLNQTAFPLNEIVDAYRGEAKDLVFDDDFIDRLLNTQKDDRSCFSILALLFPDLDYTQSLDIDHLHPAEAFKEQRLDAIFGLGDLDRLSFFKNPENWNSIANLHLLSSGQNRAKQDMPLEEWFDKQNGMNLEDLLIPAGTELAFESFEKFIKTRSAYMKQKLRSLVGGSDSQENHASPNHPGHRGRP